MNDIKLIAFDLDSTLLQGFEFSWKLVWDYLGYEDSLRIQGVKDFLSKKITYEEWNYYCLDYFKKRNLKKEDFNKICKNIKIIKNLKETITKLKQKGIVTAIVSGGINTFLEECIPDYKKYFDYIFINKFEYDNNNLLKSVQPTSYDFERKFNAIKFICNKENIDISQTVFIGNSDNDKFVIENVGLGIYIKNEDNLGEIFKKLKI